MDKESKKSLREIAKMLNRHSQELFSLSGGMPQDTVEDDPARGEREVDDYEDEDKGDSVPSMMFAFMKKSKKK